MKLQQYVEKEKKDTELIELISDSFHLLGKEAKIICRHDRTEKD